LAVSAHPAKCHRSAATAGSTGNNEPIKIRITVKKKKLKIGEHLYSLRLRMHVYILDCEVISDGQLFPSVASLKKKTKTAAAAFNNLAINKAACGDLVSETLKSHCSNSFCVPSTRRQIFSRPSKPRV